MPARTITLSPAISPAILALRTAPFVLAAALLLAGCSNLNKTEQRVLSGSAIGAATGAAATVMTGGCVGCGAAIGGAVGAGAGYVVDQMEK